LMTQMSRRGGTEHQALARPSGAEERHHAAPASLTGTMYCNIFQ
jgi:hypothetical protein